MPGNFKPFQSKQEEVVRLHEAGSRKKALKLFEKFQQKRPCVWCEVQDLVSPATEKALAEFTGEPSVAVFVTGTCPPESALLSFGALEALVTRLWRNFNKLYLIRFVPANGSDMGAGQPM